MAKEWIRGKYTDQTAIGPFIAVERCTAMQEVEGSKPQTEPTLGVLKYVRRMCCLCHDICKWLYILVFSVKDVVVGNLVLTTRLKT